MQSFIAFALLVAAAVALPLSDPKDTGAVVTRFDNNNIGVQGFEYGYETSNGLTAQEQGQIKNPGTENEALEVRGQFSYPGPDGITYTVTYIANENGFQPSAAHLPVSPQ